MYGTISNKKLSIGYSEIYELRRMSLKKELTLLYIEGVEEFFLIRKKYIQGFVFSKYNSCFKFLLAFWSSTDYFAGTMISRGKKNIFLVLKNECISESSFETSIVLRKMESSWLSFSQCYRRQYIRDIRFNNDDLDNLVQGSQSSTVNLLKELEVIDWDLKGEMDRRLGLGIKLLLILKKKINEKTLKLEDVTEVESYFKKNDFELTDIIVAKYYSRYVRCMCSFWNTCLSKEEGINLFDIIREGSIIEDIDKRFLIVINKMEELWVACDHIYTMYQIRTIRKQYML